jgi:hypothetical protein
MRGKRRDPGFPKPLEWVLFASPRALVREMNHPVHLCSRCAYRWRQRVKPEALPRACPRCRSPRWFVPRDRKPNSGAVP